MDIRDIEDMDMPFRTGKYVGQSIRSVLLRDRNYINWCLRERPEMFKVHKSDGKGKSPFRDEEYTSPKPQYGSGYKKPYGGYGGGGSYKSNSEKIQENFDRWGNPSSWMGRTFEEPPDTGMSRYDLRNPMSWGSPAAGGEIEEGDSED